MAPNTTKNKILNMPLYILWEYGTPYFLKVVPTFNSAKAWSGITSTCPCHIID